MQISFRPARLAAAFVIFATPVGAVPSVVADTPPIHSIAARVMEGVGEPALILPPGASPHSYSLRPSEARALSKADLVVWVGPGLTPWLGDSISTLAGGARTLTLDKLPGLTLLPIRATGLFEADVHDAHDHEHEGDGHDADEHEGEEAERSIPGMDQHLWLDPTNAGIFAETIASELAALDPENAAAYRANADTFGAELAALAAEVTRTLLPAHGKPFIVFHDAYQYFEHRFAIPAAGSVALHDGEAPGAARVTAIRDRVRAEGVVCAFSEPQLPPKLLATITEGTGARTGTLDPEGAALAPGTDLYPTLLRALATDLAECLAAP